MSRERVSAPRTRWAGASAGPSVTASPGQPDTPQGGAPAPKTRRRLFIKYVALFMAVVCVALLANGMFEVFFSYREHKAALIRIQREQAEAAAAKLGQFIREIESQLGWTTQLPWSAGLIEQRRFDALRLLRQVPAITELAQLDATGKERLHVSRLAMDVVDSEADFATALQFTEAMVHKVYYGPVYFRRDSEPYMTLSLAGTRRNAGVSVAEVNLKLIWDVVSQIKVGARGHAYVVDAQGRLIAHPDISLVLRNTNMSQLAQVRAASSDAAETTAEPVQVAQNIQGQQVLTASARVTPLGWLVFVELPVAEAYGPLYAALQRSGLVLLAALGLAVLAGVFLARRMVGPIQALRAGAARIGSGDLAQHIAIKTGDELEALADQFNDMASRLQESYTGLEEKVELRTRELRAALEQNARLFQEVEEKGKQLEAANLRMRTELDFVGQMQQLVLPTPDELAAIDGLDIAAFMEPADEVGGDYYDVLYTDGVVTIGIGDVTGHGLESGMLMVMTQAAVRTLQEIRESDPVRFLDILNRTLYHNVQRMRSDKNLTLALLTYAQGQVRISGQHEEAIIVRHGGAIERINTIDLGFPLGLAADIAGFVRHISVALQPGDGVVLYTDGITEAADMHHRLYGIDRLCTVISQHWDRTAQDIQAAVIADVRCHIGAQKVFDDITLVVVKQR
jgi:serine phosphatase RsbU (regulator of sigma subunit)